MDRRFRRLIHLGGAALIAACLGASLAVMLSGAFALTVLPGPVFLCCGVCVAVLTLGSWSRKTRMAAVLLATGILLALICPPVNYFGKLAAFFRSLLHYDGTSDFTQYASVITMTSAVLLTILYYWMARMSGGVYPALTLSVILFMGVWFLNNELHPLYTVMVIASLGAMLARASDEKVSYLRAVPAALLAALLALTFLPPAGVTFPPLHDAAQKIHNLFDDYFLFSDPRITYSISADGFQSKGELLGGPAHPSSREIMQVKTDVPLLMRGSVKRTYTTYSWTENVVNSRYVFIDPTRRGVRDNVFDSTRLDGLNGSKAFRSVQADVTMLSEGISTLFVPHRLTDFSAPLDLVTYFSSSGEVFITRDVQPGDAYSLTALVPTGSEKAMAALLNEAAARGDNGNYEKMRAAYTALPQGIRQDVLKLAKRVTENQSTPYAKALAIERYLTSHYKYSLDVPYPPQGQDFVSYFLLEGKEGYCSYFASAMAVMARMVGLPARYVEGYLVPAREGGSTRVTGKNAHAWVEIYFEGAGWISFNPTPGNGESAGSGSDGGSSVGDAEPSPPPEGDSSEEPEPTPTPEPTVSPTNDEDNGASEDADSEEEPENPEEDPESENEPPDQPEEPESPEDPDQPDQPDPPADHKLLYLLLLLPMIGLIAAFILKRLRDSDPIVITHDRIKNPEERLSVWYRALLVLLEQQGQTPAAGETPAQFAQRLTQTGLAGDAFSHVARQMGLTRYARQQVESSAFGQARAAYDHLKRQLKPIERLRWLRQRIVHGLGSTNQIP